MRHARYTPRLLTIFALVVVATLAGCKHKPKGPVGVTWKDNLASFDEAPGEMLFVPTARVSLEKTELIFQWFSAPEGAKVTIGGRALSFAELKDTRISVKEAMFSVPAKSAFDVTYSHDFALPIVFTINGHELATKAPSLPVAHGLKELLSQVKTGKGVDFGGGAPGARHSVVFFGDPLFKLYGPAEKLGDIDRVAFETRSEPRPSKKTCGGYRTMGKPDSKSLSLVLKLVDFTEEVFDRKSGRSLEKKTFQAPDACPSITAAVGGKYAESYPDQGSIDVWIRSHADGK